MKEPVPKLEHSHKSIEKEDKAEQPSIDKKRLMGIFHWPLTLSHRYENIQEHKA